VFASKEKVMSFQTGYIEYDEPVGVDNPAGLIKGIAWAVAIMMPFYGILIGFVVWLSHR
jgi:hypothetical protein